MKLTEKIKHKYAFTQQGAKDMIKAFGEVTIFKYCAYVSVMFALFYGRGLLE